MKKIASLLVLVLSVAIGAAAQQQINFSDMPLIGAPAPLPTGYGTLNWTNFWYVDPNQYADAGPGYRNLFTHRDVAFIGGQFCGPVGPGCYGVITPMGEHAAFQAVNAIMAAGYRAHPVTVRAYNQGRFVGSYRFIVTTLAQLVTFPATWGTITELQIQTDVAGDLVVLDLSIYTIVP